MLHNAFKESQVFLHAKDLTTTAETAENLLEVVNESIDVAQKLYNTKVYCIVSDNASNMKKMGQLSGLWYSNCNSHTANLLAKDISNTPEIALCLAQAHSVLKEFKHPELERRVTENKGYRMKLPCDTRWCSNLDASSCLVSNFPIMRQVVVASSNDLKIKQDVKKLLFDDDFETQCQDCIDLLNPICELINTAHSAECTLADVVDLWLNLKTNHVYNKEHYREIIQRRVESALNIYALTAYYLDINKDFKKLQDDMQEKVYNFLLEELHKNGIEEWVQFRESMEIFKSLKEKGITNWQSFWKTAKLKCPKLSELAMKLLKIPASSVQIERLFSNWSYVHSSVRNRLTFDRSKKLLYVYYSLKLTDNNKSEEY
ncbi:hypothetical protein ILUMI_07306 [Ignelater luminosus]|uniref:HAT C-terminal dimerisation domain-containing protein n=1 Tax=Ignelater luminosus TaxID=2038154 RepID=A0A8K0D922_IGNLU|nr:hypothetical protein ILUMI_07306 [Ignelater luminosus]